MSWSNFQNGARKEVSTQIITICRILTTDRIETVYGWKNLRDSKFSMQKTCGQIVKLNFTLHVEDLGWKLININGYSLCDWG